MRKTTVEDWTKLRYSLNESKTLVRLSEIDSNMANISAEEASENLVETMKNFNVKDDEKTREILNKINQMS